MQALIDAEAAAFVDEQRARSSSTGEPVLLNPQAYSTMALVIHELVTNSTKYGSLSVDGGRSTHRLARATPTAIWCSTGARAAARRSSRRRARASAPPSSTARCPTISAARPRSTIDRDGRARRASASRRATCPKPTSVAGPAIRFPRPPSAIRRPRRRAMLAGHDVLLVEDSLIIALDAEDIARPARRRDRHDGRDGRWRARLHRRQHARRSPCSTSTSATAPASRSPTGWSSWASRSCSPPATASRPTCPTEHRGRPVVQKPYTLENVARAIDGLLG